MGNSNCTKCLQEIEGNNEMNLNPSVSINKFIISVYSKFRDSNSQNDTHLKKIVKNPQSDSTFQTHSIIKIQSVYKSYVCQKQYTLIKKLLRKNHNYFSLEDIKHTVSCAKMALKRNKLEKFIYPSGTVYKGEWLGGFRDGYGIQEWPDGASYQGSWSFGYPYGFGKFVHIDGDSFSGEWKNPYAAARTQYSGSPKSLEELSKNIEDGYIWLWYKQESFALAPPKPQSSKFSMHHEKSVKNIQKKIKSHIEAISDAKVMLEEIFTEKFEKMFAEVELEGGAKYKGEMLSGKREGKGINKWENGDRYMGEWERDLQHGWGWNTWIDGSSYVGGYKDNLKDGIGEYIWEDGTRYIGTWKDNTIEGIGKYLWSDGREYQGEWLAGLMHGFGMFVSKEGKEYQGKWLQGKKHGVGYSISPDGKVTLDSWEKGRIQKPNIL